MADKDDNDKSGKEQPQAPNPIIIRIAPNRLGGIRLG